MAQRLVGSGIGQLHLDDSGCGLVVDTFLRQETAAKTHQRPYLGQSDADHHRQRLIGVFCEHGWFLVCHHHQHRVAEAGRFHGGGGGVYRGIHREPHGHGDLQHVGCLTARHQLLFRCGTPAKDAQDAACRHVGSRHPVLVCHAVSTLRREAAVAAVR